MKTYLGVIFVLLIAGCGSTSTFSLEAARTICAANSNEPASDLEWESVVVFLEAFRDDGTSKLEALTDSAETCSFSEVVPENCFVCITALIDAIWP